MIIVRVELHSAITGKVSELGRVIIDNIGGTAQRGNYRVRALRGRSREALDKAERAVLCGDAAPQKQGEVKNHARLQEHVWNLVAKALGAVGYGKEKA